MPSARSRAQGPSSSFGSKRSRADDETIRRRRKGRERLGMCTTEGAAKRASATFVHELEEPLGPATGTSSSEAAPLVAEAVLAETRETVEVLQVSALQQQHSVIHRVENDGKEFITIS